MNQNVSTSNGHLEGFFAHHDVANLLWTCACWSLITQEEEQAAQYLLTASLNQIV